MAKKKNKLEIVIDETNIKEKEIIGADIKDGYCHYTYEVKKGHNAGDVILVKGKGIVHDDMYEAFAKLKIHLACIDDVANELHEDESLFRIDGFRTKGNKEDESIVIKGSKHVKSVNDRISIVTPKIPLAPTGGYKFWTQLLETTEILRAEVEAYMNGKYAPAEETINPNQMSIEMTNVEDEMEGAKV